MALRPIVETCQPRSDVLVGGLTDAHFAAQLDLVVSTPEKYPVYGDPNEFFAVTYPTEGLKRLLASTFGRLAGQAGAIDGAEHGVVRFQTSFGGGKTHGLIVAYDLAAGARPMLLDQFVDRSLLPDDCAVAAVVGDTLDSLSGTEVKGKTVFTMWGAIAAQLGDDAWAAIAKHDESRTAPSSEQWVRLFEKRPTLVIIDEIAAHLRALDSSGDGDLRRQADAVPSFLFNLFTAAARVDTARVVITLASQKDAFAKQTSQIEKLLDESSTSARTPSQSWAVSVKYWCQLKTRRSLRFCGAACLSVLTKRQQSRQRKPMRTSTQDWRAATSVSACQLTSRAWCSKSRTRRRSRGGSAAGRSRPSSRR